jgi:hypothetical protein
MEVWPSYLPKPLLGGHGFTPGNGVIHSPMGAGNIRSRRRFKNVPSKFGVKLLMGTQQNSLFEHFVENNISSGADWFEMPVLLATGLETVEVKIIKFGKATAKTNTKWIVPLELLIKSRPVISLESAEVLQVFDVEAIERAAKISEGV